MKAALSLLVVLALPPVARAGGDFVDLHAGRSRVWFVGEPGVLELDARTGRTVAMPRLHGAAYPLSVTVAGGAAWVASVENGFVDGRLSRIDLRTHRVRVVWHRGDSSVQYVAAGAGSVWALIGQAGGNEIARFAQSGRLVRTWRVPGAGRMAADGEGCWISTNGRLLHIDAQGAVHAILRAPIGDVATGLGSVWLPAGATIVRFDERTGRTQTLHTGRLVLGGFQHDLAAGDGALWALGHEYTPRSSTLERLDLSGRITGHVVLPGIADAVAVTPTAVWVGAVDGYRVMRFDPRTLRRTLTVDIG